MKERIRIHRAKHASSDEKTPDLHRFIERLDQQAPGQPLRDGEKEFLRAGTGHEFEHVRIHADTEADQLSRAVHAKAFTVGQDIFFRAGAYDSSTPEGSRLLAHEAAHTLQQGPGRQPSTGDIEVSQASDPTEVEADRIASTIAGGGPATAPRTTSSTAASMIHREEEEKPERPKPEPPEPAAATPNPMAVAMFDAGVIGQIEKARESLDHKKPEVQQAIGHLESAGGVLGGMSKSAKDTGNDLLSAECTTVYDILWGDKQALNAHIGIKRPLGEVREDLDTSNQERMGKIVKRIEEML